MRYNTSEKLELLESVDTFLRRRVELNTTPEEFKEIYRDQLNWNSKQRLRLAKLLLSDRSA